MQSRDVGVIVSVNVGRPRVVAADRGPVDTAIWKTPVGGRVAVRPGNLDGDAQADLEHHGGVDKAVYAYATEDAAWWSSEFGTEMEPGIFGENLTTQGVDVTGAVVGERWRVGECLLEVRQPRIPCFKLAIRTGRPDMVRRFGDAVRPGAYLSVLETGAVWHGAAVQVEDRPAHGVTVGTVFDAYLHRRAALVELVRRVPGLPPTWHRAAAAAAGAPRRD